MFPADGRLERNLASIGLAMFLIGIVFLLGGTIVQAFQWAAAYRNEIKLGHSLLEIINDTALGISYPLTYNGVVLYVVGRLVSSWRVSIVGFEQSPTNLVVRGPDETNTVWIGKKHESTLDAEATAETLARRFGQES